MRIPKALIATPLLLFVFCTIPRDNPFDPKNPDYIELNGPDSVYAEAISWTTVRLSWKDENELENGYAIEKKPDTSNIWETVGRTGPDAEFFLDTACDTATTYNYRVYAFNDVYERRMRFGYYVTVRTPLAPDDTILSAPIITAITAADTNLISMRWADSIYSIAKGNLKRGFVLQRSVNNDRNFVTIEDSLAPTVHAYLDQLVSTFRTYYYRVAAFNNAGLGPWSDTASVSTFYEFPENPRTVGLWHMNDMRTDSLIDSSGNSNHGVLLHNPIPDNDGRFNSCYYIYNDSSEIVVPVDSFPRTEMALEFYFKPFTTYDSMTTAIKGILWVENGPVQIYYRNGMLAVIFYGTVGSDTLRIPANFPQNQWSLISVAAGVERQDVLINRDLNKFVHHSNPMTLLFTGPPVIHVGRAADYVSPVDTSRVTRIYGKGKFDEMRLLDTYNIFNY